MAFHLFVFKLVSVARMEKEKQQKKIYKYIKIEKKKKFQCCWANVSVECHLFLLDLSSRSGAVSNRYETETKSSLVV